jgi:ferredoxin
LFKVDLIINFAKLKTHGLTQVTLCTKNLYGCIPGKLKEQLHRVYPDAKEFSILLNRIELQIKPGLCFIDGIIGLEGDGPGASGTPISSKVLIAGNHCGAVDIVATELMGFNPMSIYTNKNYNLKKENIKVVGSGKDVKLNFKKPSSSAISIFLWINKFLPKPKIIADEDKCVKCGICVKKCPVQALSLNPHAICNHKICIRCLCCVEVCPHNAIHLEESFFKKFLSLIASKIRKV